MHGDANMRGCVMCGRGDYDTLDALTIISLPFARTDFRSGSLERGLRMSVWRVSEGDKQDTRHKTRCGGGEGRNCTALTIRVLRTSHARTQIGIVVPNAAVDAVPHALVHADRDVVGAADVEVDEEATVGLFGRVFEQLAEVAGDREPSVLWCYCHRGDVAVPVGIVTFRLANDCFERCAREREHAGEGVCVKGERGWRWVWGGGEMNVNIPPAQ